MFKRRSDEPAFKTKWGSEVLPYATIKYSGNTRVHVVEEDQTYVVFQNFSGSDEFDYMKNLPESVIRFLAELPSPKIVHHAWLRNVSVESLENKVSRG